jgi:hypothetical protein
MSSLTIWMKYFETNVAMFQQAVLATSNQSSAKSIEDFLK